MSNFKILSGDELVKKGLTGLEASLPEVGLKDVVPNGSWLEQKQIQSALESKKQLIEIERIEKIGTLSQAEWKKDINLAEVTHKVGGYWQYLGHNVGPTLYLKPEEALFLMEINSLLLKFDGVKVSLQQAYFLLLQGDVSLLKFKVYASLSRIGYKVLRHKKCENQEKDNIDLYNNDDDTPKKEERSDVPLEENRPSSSYPTSSEPIKEENDTRKNHVQSYSNAYKSYQTKIVQLKLRKLRQGSIKNFLDNIPELIEKRTVTLKVPEAKYVPKNMGLNDSYTINIQNFSKKHSRTADDAFTYSPNDEANGSHVKRLKASSNDGSSSSYTPYRRNCTHNYRHHQFRPFYSLRPPSFNYFNIDMIFQRPLAHQIFFPSLLQTRGPHFVQRPVFFNYSSFNTSRWNRFPTVTHSNNRKMHFERLKQLAQRLKQFVARGNVSQQNIQSLQRVIITYNTKYKTNWRLDPCFEIICDGPVVETIELDLDDDEPCNKKLKVDNEILENNLKSVQQIALQLKNLEIIGKATARHRRTFSKLLKTFNRCFNVDYYVDSSYNIMDRSHIALDSDSETDPVIKEEIVEQPVTKHKKSKKLKNPFNILKRLSEKQDAFNEGNTSGIGDSNGQKNNNYTAITRNNFSKDWLPNENDFGRVELVENHILDPLLDINKTVLLYDFAKFKSNESWLGLKINFLESLKDTLAEFHNGSSVFQSNFDMDCLVTPGDCRSTESILKKLTIIQTKHDTRTDSLLSIDYDVYNRDVENFRKTDPPAPHFRVICLDESRNIPSASEIEALHSVYSSNIPIVFALVSTSSVSYLQIKPMEIPVHTSNA